MSARTDLPSEPLPATRIKKHGGHRIPAIIFALVMALSVCLLCSGCGASSQSKSSSSKSDEYKQETFHDISFSVPKEMKGSDSPYADAMTFDLGANAKDPFAAGLYISIFPGEALTAQDIYDATHEYEHCELVSANGIEMCWNPNAYSDSDVVNQELSFSYNGSLYMAEIHYKTDSQTSYKEFAENFYKSIKPADTNSTSKGSGQSKSFSSPPRANIILDNGIEWKDASFHVGETVTLYGPVVGTEYASTSNGKPTFLDIGADYPSKNRLSITIWGKNRSAFSTPPEKLYEGKTVAVRGKVYLYDGVCNVEVTSPDQITVL